MSTDEHSSEYNKSLQEEIDRLKADKLALQSEFNELAENDDGSMTPDAARKALIAAGPVAIQQITTLAAFADSESVRANCSKYIIDVCLGRIQIGNPEDKTFEKLLTSLKGNDPKKAATSTPPSTTSSTSAKANPAKKDAK